ETLELFLFIEKSQSVAIVKGLIGLHQNGNPIDVLNGTQGFTDRLRSAWFDDIGLSTVQKEIGRRASETLVGIRLKVMFYFTQRRTTVLVLSFPIEDGIDFLTIKGSEVLYIVDIFES